MSAQKLSIPLARTFSSVFFDVADLFDRVLVVDVHTRKGHIACDASTEAEIVVPLLAKGKTVGVLDLDSIGLSFFKL